MDHLRTRWEALQSRVQDELRRQGFKDDRIQCEVMLNCRFDGTDTALMTPKPKDSEDFKSAFVEQYKREFGFVLEKPVIVDDVRVKGVGRSFDSLGLSVWQEKRDLDGNGKWKPVQGDRIESTTRVYFEGDGWIDVPVLLLDRLDPGDLVKGWVEQSSGNFSKLTCPCFLSFFERAQADHGYR